MSQYYCKPSDTSGQITSSPYVPAETTLDLDDPLVFNAGTGTLTLPAVPPYYGVYNLIGANPSYTVNKTANVQSYVTELRSLGSKTVNFTLVAEASAVANDLVGETAGPIAIVGAGDWISMRKISGELFNRKVGSSTYS